MRIKNTILETGKSSHNLYNLKSGCTNGNLKHHFDLPTKVIPDIIRRVELAKTKTTSAYHDYDGGDVSGKQEYNDDFLEAASRRRNTPLFCRGVRAAWTLGGLTSRLVFYVQRAHTSPLANQRGSLW